MTQTRPSTTGSPGAGLAERRHGFPFVRSDVIAFAAAIAVIALSRLIGVLLTDAGQDMVLPWPPLVAFWHPHVGWGTPLAVIAALLGLRLQQQAAGMSWRQLLLFGWLLMLGWLCSLALIDGFHQGWTNVLLDPNEYLHDLPRISSAHAFLSTFTSHIRYGTQPELAWTTHVAGHPPLATLVFYALSKIGLGGGFWAGTLCIVASSVVAVSLPVAVHGLAGEAPARRLVPLIALFPGAVWMGVSADGMFAGVALSGLALSVLAATRGALRSRIVLGLIGGLLLGASVFMSYGLAVYAVVVLTALVITVVRNGPRAWPAWVAAVIGAVVVFAMHLVLGFNWFSGLSQLKIRYFTSVASRRPYSYFVYADIGAWLISCSPLLAIGIGRAIQAVRAGVRGRTWDESLPVALLCLSGLLAALLADLSALSKAETERIWLTFGIVAFSGLALLRGRAARWALIGTAANALLVNHLLDTGW